MLKRFSTLAAAFAVASLAFAAVPTFAASHSATVTINGSVAQSCTAFDSGTGTLTFPAYDAFNNASTDLASSNSLTFTTHCTKGGSNVFFTVDGGSNYAHTSGTRAMKSTGTSDYLNYGLFSDSGHSTAWTFNSTTGAGNSGGNLTIASSSDNQTLNLYGLIPHGQDPSVATDYTDTVTVAINY